MNEQHLGSSLDDFLAEEGLLAEAEAVAIKRVITFQILQLMIEQKTPQKQIQEAIKRKRKFEQNPQRHTQEIHL